MGRLQECETMGCGGRAVILGLAQLPSYRASAVWH